MSSAEAELVAASSIVQEVIFLRKFLDNLVSTFKQNGPTLIFADNETIETCIQCLLSCLIHPSDA